MGLLNKAKIMNSSDTRSIVSGEGAAFPGNILDTLKSFHRENPLFHCILLQKNDGTGKALAQSIELLINGYHAVCVGLSSGKCLVLLPGGLDKDIFAHRLSKSTGSLMLSQSSADSISVAVDTLSHHLL